MLVHMRTYTHTHTHTHIYIYIYIERVEIDREMVWLVGFFV